MATDPPLPAADPGLDTQLLDIFGPSFQLQPFQHAAFDRSRHSCAKAAVTAPKSKDTTTSTAPTTHSSASSTSKPGSAPAAADDLYCRACKKKFNNAATMQNHVKSAKHIANAKKAGQKAQAPANASAKAPSKPPPKPSPFAPKEPASTAPVAASKVAQKDELEAKLASIKGEPLDAYLALAHDYYHTHHAPLSVAKTLIAACDTHPQLAMRPRRLLARLFCLYDLPMAHNAYLDLIQHAFAWPASEINALAETANITSVSGMQDKCRLLSSRAWDFALIQEAAAAFAQPVALEVTGSKVPQATLIALVLYHIVLAHCPSPCQPIDAACVCQTTGTGLTAVYRHIGMPHAAMDVQLLLLHHQAKKASAESLHKIVLVPLATWLVLCLEKDDLVRMQHANDVIALTNGDEFLEIKVALKISEYRRSMGSLWEAMQAMEELKLQWQVQGSKTLVHDDHVKQQALAERLHHCLDRK
ncbi:hypothetical protein BC940DRAFT_307177 [Gongronella butleri]|nr:hypothetical protein BC940DRAFT_307177 [Gongronella butleri]